MIFKIPGGLVKEETAHTKKLPLEMFYQAHHLWQHKMCTVYCFIYIYNVILAYRVEFICPAFLVDSTHGVGSKDVLPHTHGKSVLCLVFKLCMRKVNLNLLLVEEDLSSLLNKWKHKNSL